MDKISTLYPTARRANRKSFVGVKRQTVPNQSMSLREIVRRFVRRESLPLSHEGLYEDRFGDLEKLKHADIVEQMDRVKELKEQIKAFQDREEKRRLQAIEDAKPKASDVDAVSNSGAGETPIKSPPKGGVTG